MTKAADGLEIHNQLFLPKDLKPGEKRPAIVFVHGGPVRQMLPGYHYMQFYHWAYGINQWLASQGYVVLSVNYRSGIGYGRSFRTAPNTARGRQRRVPGRGRRRQVPAVAAGRRSEPRRHLGPVVRRAADVAGAGAQLRHRSRPASTSRACTSTAARSTRRPVGYKSSAVGAIDGWKSPVLLVHGDDDRNVAFQQTTGLVQLLRARDVYYELIVFPDDTHESMLHSRWMYTLDRMDAFLKRFLGGGATTTSQRLRWRSKLCGCARRELESQSQLELKLIAEQLTRPNRQTVSTTLPMLPRLLDEAVRVGGVIERERARDDRREAAGRELAHQQVDRAAAAAAARPTGGRGAGRRRRGCG